MQPIVIIGAGMAAYSLARELRKLDKTSRLTIVTADSGGAYAKPMLSNAFALNKQASQLMSASAEQMAIQLDASIVAGTRVHGIDATAKTISTEHGIIEYSRLVLALGAQAIRLPLAGDAADRILSINHLDDYAVFRQQLEQLGGAARIAILGAGLIGCEFAEDLSAAGHHVTLVDPNLRPLSALAAPALSQGLTDAWATRSITLELNTTASAIDALGNGALRLSLANGKHLETDIVLSAVGLRPAIALAHSAQLKRDAASRSTNTAAPATPASTRWAIAPNTAANSATAAPPPRPAPCCPTWRRCWRRRAPSPPRWPARRRPSN